MVRTDDLSFEEKVNIQRKIVFAEDDTDIRRRLGLPVVSEEAVASEDEQPVKTS